MSLSKEWEQGDLTCKFMYKPMFAFSLHTQKMPITREWHPMESAWDRRKRSEGGLGSECQTASNLCHVQKRKLKVKAVSGEKVILFVILQYSLG